MANDKAKAAEEAAAKAAEEDDGLVELTNGTEIVRAHPNQMAHWGTQGFVPVESSEEA